jgi:hypothetical protein
MADPTIEPSTAAWNPVLEIWDVFGHTELKKCRRNLSFGIVSEPGAVPVMTGWFEFVLVLRRGLCGR